MSPDRSRPLLSCRNLSKYFGAMAAVKDFDLDVRAGEVLGIGGPNGAGKTTLLDVISGHNPASAGAIEFDGRDITRLKPELICHRGIARTFQLNAGFDTLTVRENVAVGAGFGTGEIGLARLSSGLEAERRVEQALQVVGLEAKADHLVGGLAVLDRKLLMLAGALATDPKLLLIDEPVGGLNPSEIDQVMGIVGRVLELGITILLIEHVMRFLLQLSTRVVIMHHGEMIYDGLPGGLVRDERVIDVYLGEGTAARLLHFLESDRGDGQTTATH